MIPRLIASNVAFVAIRAYAAYSYLYYEKDESLVADEDFDALCKWLLQRYDVLKPYDLNDYLDRSALEAGTGYQLTGRVCGMTRKWAEELLAAHKSKKKSPPRKAPAKDNLAFLD